MYMNESWETRSLQQSIPPGEQDSKRYIQQTLEKMWGLGAQMPPCTRKSAYKLLSPPKLNY